MALNGYDAIVVGAGVAGLACAVELRERGLDTVVLEKSRGVGGRCATRRIAGIPVDHGLAFYHGDDPEFLAALDAVEPEAPFPWPRRVVGSGAPCQANAFREPQRRLAFAAGVTAFPKYLARELRVSLGTHATGLTTERDRLVVETDAGARWTARSVVLALPPAQSVRLLATLPADASPELAAVAHLLEGISTVRCLTAMAVLAEGASAPDWDVCYPESSDILQAVIVDSSKRASGARPVFVLQARPAWSAARWDDPPEAWAREMLRAAVDLAGEGIVAPERCETHRWRYARLTGGDALTAAPLVRTETGARLGVTGEATSPGGGVQAAWRGGRSLALRLTGDSA